MNLHFENITNRPILILLNYQKVTVNIHISYRKLLIIVCLNRNTSNLIVLIICCIVTPPLYEIVSFNFQLLFCILFCDLVNCHFCP
jgi:hypothetical protein